MSSETQESIHNTEEENPKETLIKGKYRIIKPFVVSSIRAVYLAENVETNQLCSLREFLPRFLAPEEKIVLQEKSREIFEQLAQLQHPNLASILDYFFEGSFFYAVYEYINGPDITKHIDPHKILTDNGYPESLVSTWARQMCNLIEYIHHQTEPIFLVDFKPAGVVFNKESEELAFIDLGLSKILSLLGSHYLLTEDFQSYRKAGKKFESIKWDLYCFGNYLYYLLTGINLLKKADNIVQPIQSLRPDISQDMINIIEKALGENFQSHYDDINQIKEDLQKTASPLPLSAFDFYQDFFLRGSKAETTTNWPMFQGNCYRNNTMGLLPRIPIHLNWTCKINPSSHYLLYPCDEYIYVISKEGLIYGIHNKTGEIEWKSLVSKNINVPGLAHNKNLFFITPNNEAICIEHGHNNFKWKVNLKNSVMTSPFLHEQGILFLPLYNGAIQAVNFESGEILAEYSIEGNIITSPLLHDKTIYVPSLNKTIYAIDVNTKEIKWQTESSSGFSCPPTIYENKLYCGTYDGTIYTIDSKEGNNLWIKNLKASINQSIQATKHSIICLASNGIMSAIDSENGDIIWQKDFSAQKDNINFIYSQNLLFTLDKSNNLNIYNSYTGALRQNLTLSHPAASQAIIAHNKLYIASSGYLAALGNA